MNGRTRCVCAVAFVLLLVMGHAALAAYPVVPKEITDTLVAERWAIVAEQSANPDGSKASPVLRAVRGHACLALNRNNESLLLFASLRSRSDAKAWHAWTRCLAEAHPEARVAHYLHGDALLRVGRVDEAIKALTRSIGPKGDFAMALIARGVAHARRNDWRKSRDDFDRAVEVAPQLAEAYASLGNLQVLRRAAVGAMKSYGKALTLCPNYALALNGRGCAQYGLGQWEQAGKSFAAAAEAAPYAVFLANLKAVTLSAEHVNMPGQEGSPLFRFSDFLDWDALRARSLEDGDVFRTFMGGPLPAEQTGDVLAAMNDALANGRFYETVEGRLDLKTAPGQLVALVETTRAARRKARLELAKVDGARVVMLNRLVLEHAYPGLIARHDQRDPGNQLTLTRGLVDMNTHRKGLDTGQILSGQNRTDNLWRPMADAVEKVPLIGVFGSPWNRHLDNATRANDRELQSRHGMGVRDMMPGGVSTELRRGFVDKGNWPVTSCFGLLPDAFGGDDCE